MIVIFFFSKWDKVIDLFYVFVRFSVRVVEVVESGFVF